MRLVLSVVISLIIEFENFRIYKKDYREALNTLTYNGFEIINS